jgi:hypothetical protein
MRLRLLVLVCATLLAGAAAAQDIALGTLNAVAYRVLPAGAPMMVRALDNAPANLQVQADIERELQAAGFVVAKDATLVLTFETRDDIGAWSVGPRRSVIELEGHGGRSGGEEARARINLFDSGRGGLFNEGRAADTVQATLYRLDFTLDDRGNGQRIWAGWATGELEQTDGFALVRAMVPALARAVGKTVRRQPIPAQ